MMNKPYIDELSQKGESRYTLIAVAAKRARQITADNPELSRSGAINPVSQALHEINDDKLKWHHHCKDAEQMLFSLNTNLPESVNTAEAADEPKQNFVSDDNLYVDGKDSDDTSVDIDLE